ncbi:hypothetical protein [Desulfosarcina variabilis]|uniref:hypothetical protein n=1 Tax=Desulfosarcina variabilis TaxID=2300 RepID=UPI003AFAEBB9
MVDKTKIDALTSTNETDEYRFGYTCEEIERLRYQHHVWAKENQRFISRAGFSKGATLVDLGCGPGGRGTQSSRVKYTMSKIQNQILNKKWPYPSIVWFMVACLLGHE